jgi:hypothetical protein
VLAVNVTKVGEAMGDKGKKDKDKARKQKVKKQEQTAKENLEKAPAKAVDRMNGQAARF